MRGYEGGLLRAGKRALECVAGGRSTAPEHPRTSCPIFLKEGEGAMQEGIFGLGRSL